MKTNRNAAIISLLIIALVFNFNLFAQEKESYSMVELSFMMPKNDHVKDFENAVKQHNDKFHPDGPYGSGLDMIVTGPKAGWYAWYMGPCTFTDLDNRPDDSAHGQDWNANVNPHVHKYGAVEYWKFNKDLSYTNGKQTKYSEIWFLDIKRGEYEKFKGIMEKIKAVHAKRADETIAVYNNQYAAGDGRDVALVFDFEKWADMDDDNFKMKEEYEAMYGKDTWKTFLDDWTSATEKVVQQVWKEVN